MAVPRWQSAANAAIASFLLISAFALLNAHPSDAQLRVGFYSSSCPNAESIVRSVVTQATASDRTVPPAMLRLLFHDCFVQGCDASVLIKFPNNTAESNNNRHQGLRSLDVIDKAKAQLEAQCPGVVSCADIVVLAARDAVALTQGPNINVPTGRRDSRVSFLSAADDLPIVEDSVDSLRSKFASRGLSDSDLVILSAAHTIGTTACFFLQDRLYTFEGETGSSDPSINPMLLPSLQQACQPGDSNTRIPLDIGSENTFDAHILSNIQSGDAVIQSDAALYSDMSTRSVVDSYNGLLSNLLGRGSDDFVSDFSDAMVRMSSIGVLTGSAGEIRKVCSSFN